MKMNQAGFALQIVNMPSGGAGQGSTMNSLRSAWTGASAWRPTLRSGRSQLSEVEKGNLLYNDGILMEDKTVAVGFLKAQQDDYPQGEFVNLVLV